MNNRECVEKLINNGFKAQIIADVLHVTSSYISKYRKGTRNLSKKREKILTEFLEKYKNIL